MNVTQGSVIEYRKGSQVCRMEVTHVLASGNLLGLRLRKQDNGVQRTRGLGITSGPRQDLTTLADVVEVVA